MGAVRAGEPSATFPPHCSGPCGSMDGGRTSVMPGSQGDHEELALPPPPYQPIVKTYYERKLLETIELWGLVFAAAEPGLY